MIVVERLAMQMHLQGAFFVSGGGYFMSKTFDAISSVAFLMPLICIEKYNVYFACASWVLGDIVLVGALLIKIIETNRTKRLAVSN